MTLPFLKWPGGKRWLADEVVQIVRQHLTGTYYEPFLGGGAVFFRLGPERAVLSDINQDLINTYRLVRRDPSRLERALKELEVSEEAYYRIRGESPHDPFERAVRFLFLNRTAFGGMYRLNQAGEFNVPYGGGGRTPATLWEQQLLRTAAGRLRGVSLRVSDFQSIMSEAGEGDVVYCDPTYTVAHANNGFIRYNERNFAWKDQLRLVRAACRAAERGATVVVSNADHPSLRAIYDGVTHRIVGRTSRVSRLSKGRGETTECLFIFSCAAVSEDTQGDGAPVKVP